MSKLYPRQDVILVTDPDGVEYTANDDGSFDFPDDLATQLRTTHVAGEKSWEDDAERHDRLTAEELAFRRDPANLLAAVDKLGGFNDRKQDAPASDGESVDPAEIRKHAAALLALADELDPPKKAPTRRRAPTKPKTTAPAKK